MTNLYANNAVGTLASGITNVATSLTLNVGQAALFPNPTSPDIFYATITDAATQTLKEIVQVTAVSGNVFSIVRAQDGTSALSWNPNDIVQQCTIALELRAFQKGRLLNVQTITSTGTYTPTTGTSEIVVYLLGGGGSGGGAATTTVGQQSAATGGGAGAYCSGMFTSGFSGITVTIGAGGVGAPGGANPGGQSSFGSLMVAGGGLGGTGFGGATASTAVFGVLGGTVITPGNIANYAGAPSAGATAFPLLTSVGASTAFGSGGQAAFNANGFAAIGYGAGGGGSMTANDSAVAGGNGAPGVCIIHEFS